MDANILSPPGNTSCRDIEEFTDVFRCITMFDEPEDTLLQIFADVAVDHSCVGVCQITPNFFLKVADDKVF